MNVHWKNPTESGLGDRLIDTGLLVAFARVSRGDGNKLLMGWAPYMIRPELDPPHRAVDILVGNVRQHITFPAGVEFLDHGITDQPCYPFLAYLGGGANVYDFHTQWVNQYASLQEFSQLLANVYQEFKFNVCLAIAPPYLAMHVRRTDRLRPEPPDGGIIKSSSLGALNQATLEVLAREKSNFNHVYICGDDDTQVGEFKRQARDMGWVLVESPAVEKWRSTYYDLALMSRATKVVVAHRCSSFSRFAALAGGVPFRSIFDYDGVAPL